MNVDKLYVARKQIESAIRLHLNYQDLISSHTLVQASLTILENICDARKIEYNLRPLKMAISEVLGKKGFNDFYKHKNFFKHAEKDTFEEIKLFQPEWNDILIYSAISTYSLLDSEFVSDKVQGVVFQTFQVWFILINKKKFDEKFHFIYEPNYALKNIDTSGLEKLSREHLVLYGSALLDFMEGKKDQTNQKIRHLRYSNGMIDLPLIVNSNEAYLY